MSKEPLRLTLREIGDTDFFKNSKMPRDVGSINEMDEKQFRKGVMNCIFSGRKDIPPDLVNRPIEWFDGYVSSFAVEDEKIKGLFLVRKNEEEELELILLQYIGKDSGKQMISMLRDSFRTAFSLYPDSTVVVIPRNTTGAEGLTQKLFPGR
jgi:hypothetical protein